MHLCDYPTANPELRNEELELKMRVTRKAVSMGRAIRAMHSLKIRQPLKALYLVTVDPDERKVLREMADIVREELNVKEVIFRENEEDLVEYQAKANYRALGKSLGSNMKAAAARIESLSMQEIQSLLEGSTLSLDLDFGPLELTRESVIVRRQEKENLKVLNEGSLTVALDPEISEELKAEGLVRDIIRGVQNLRKETGLSVTDRIHLYIHGPSGVEEALGEHEDFLMEETLAVSVHWNTAPLDSWENASQRPAGSRSRTAVVESGGERLTIALAKAE